jgi:hypothetical protein
MRAIQCHSAKLNPFSDNLQTLSIPTSCGCSVGDVSTAPAGGRESLTLLLAHRSSRAAADADWTVLPRVATCSSIKRLQWLKARDSVIQFIFGFDVS